MIDHDTLRQSARDIGTQASLIEQRFLAAGGRLGTAVEAVNRILPLFDTLHGNLLAPEMDHAIIDLNQVADQFTTLVADSSQNGMLLDNLVSLAESLVARLARMRAAIRGVDVLAVNAKIAAAHVKNLDHSVEGFAIEIERALKHFQGNLDLVGDRLATVIHDLREARREQQAISRHRDTTSRRIADSLRNALGEVSRRHRQAAEAANTVRHKAAAVSRGIGNSIMALQIGDTARQRLEHVQSGLTSYCDYAEANADGSAETMHSLGAATQHLQALQLQSAIDEYTANTATILSGLTQLSEETAQIIALGQAAYSADTHMHGSFLLGLTTEMVAVKDLLLGLRSTETAAGQMIAATIQSVENLANYVKAVQLLETDIRVLALNTTLKCSRLGSAGLSLSVIAQELRTCSVTIAVDAGAALRDLRELIAAGSLGAQFAMDRSYAAFDALVEKMDRSAECLTRCGLQLSDSLSALDGDGRTVAAAVSEASGLLADPAFLISPISDTAAQLQKIACPTSDELAELYAQHSTFLAQLRQSYTMRQERDIHDGFFVSNSATEPSAAQESLSPTEAIDDFLF